MWCNEKKSFNAFSRVRLHETPGGRRGSSTVGDTVHPALACLQVGMGDPGPSWSRRMQPFGRRS